VLEIPQVTDPSTLTIPVQIFAPDLTGYGQSDIDFVYNGDSAACCPGADFEDLAVHDAVTGWWAIIAYGPYAQENDPETGDPDCGVAIAQGEADALAAGKPTLGDLFPLWALELGSFDPAAPAEIDGWALFCEPLIEVPFVAPKPPVIKPKHPIPNPCPCTVNYVKV
jgi:hypothetical protein